MWVDLGTMREGRSWPPAYLRNMQANVLARDVACCQGAASPAPLGLIICKLVWPSTPLKSACAHAAERINDDTMHYIACIRGSYGGHCPVMLHGSSALDP